MTREEAIICLKGIKNYGRDTFNEQSDWQGCLDMAIKALEQQSCEDTISRQAAIDVVKGIDSNFVKYIEELPSAQPEPSIPLSWIEGQIEWLRSLDDAFASMTAGQMSAMVEKWKGEQESR